MKITDNNWSIYRCENSSKYTFSVDNEPIYSGTYTQCLIVLGALISNTHLEFAINLANQISDSNERSE